MGDLKIDTDLPDLSDDSIDAAKTAEELGFDCIWNNETSHDAFLPLPLVAEHTDSLSFGTRISLAFTRSPMVLAYLGWDLARYSDGRFILGLGTQVKGHNERRFSVDWSAPGPRLREVIESIRHIWDVFQGEADELDYQCEEYSFSLMTDTFNPGPIDDPDIPIYIAGLNEYNIRLAGELCDGLALHSFNTLSYTEEVIKPMIEEGAERGDRSADDVAVSARPFIITGDSDEAMEEQREEVRRRIAFYGSTRTYHPVLEHHGWDEIGPKLHDLSTDQRWDEMADLVTDEIVDKFAVQAPLGDLRDELVRTYGGVADRVVLPFDYVQSS